MPKTIQTVQSAREQLVQRIGANSRGAQDLLDRFDRWGEDLVEALGEIYPLDVVLPTLIDVMAAAHTRRDKALLQRDRERVLQQDWFQSPQTIGYVAYADLFAKNLTGINKRIPYLKELGVSYLHLLPILKPRPGANDGGYAVLDYRSLREDLGTMAQLRRTADKLHASGISLTLDLVLNHVAKEHEWAVKAQAGDPVYREYFHVYPTRDIPDEFEKSLLEVFPDFAPGNFTWDEQLQGWVWTTFNSYQWDVNWSNPAVFCEYADIIANLANHGVDCLRLDAIAFMWKRMGTICQGEPEVHVITQALRAFTKIFSPAMIFKAEAIVGPAQVGAYFGEGKHAGKVSDLAYHNSLMVQIWSAIAAKDSTLMVHTLSRFTGLPSTTAWGVYLRCHDDIGWAIDDTDAHEVGLNGHDHRMFLAEYFEGNFYGSLATGEAFMSDPLSGERRTSGTGASLAGIEKALALKNDKLLSLAIERYLCAYTMVFGFGGIPLLYMGDEVGMLNDHSYLKDETKAEDNRWLHRPKMNWKIADAAAAGQLDDSAAGIIYNRIKHVINVRKTLPSLHASVATTVRKGSGQGVVIFDRRHPAGDIVQVYNLSENSRWLTPGEIGSLGTQVTDHLTGHTFDIGTGIPLAPYEMRWFTHS